MKSRNEAKDCPDINLLIAMLPLLLTKVETGEVLRCGKTTVEKLIEEGELKAIQRVRKGHGSPVLVLRSSVEAYLHRSLVHDVDQTVAEYMATR